MFKSRFYKFCCLSVQDMGERVITCETQECRRTDYDTAKIIATSKCESLMKRENVTNVCVSVMHDDERVFMIASDNKELPHTE